MKKELTVRFYTDTDKHCGNKHINRKTYLELHDWITSGNYLLAINNVRIDTISKLDSLLLYTETLKRNNVI